MQRYVSYGALAAADVFVRVPLGAAAVGWAAIPVMAATTASIALFACFRFLLLDRLIYGPNMDAAPCRTESYRPVRPG